MPQAKQIACIRVLALMIEDARNAVEAIFIPDIDSELFEKSVIAAINTPEMTSNPRFRDIARECIHAGSRFKERFPFYYRRYIIEGSSSVMFECYIGDIVKIVESKPHLQKHHESDYVDLQAAMLERVKGRTVHPALKPFLDQISNTVQKKKAYFKAQEQIAQLSN